jgi:ketosteroid isomerase-like protein
MGQPAMTDRSLVDEVKDLWTTWERQGLEAMLALVPDDVEWSPLSGGGVVLRGTDEVRDFWARQESEGHREQAVAYRFDEEGDCVLVSGSLRQFAPHGWSDSQPLWGFFFRDGLLRRAVGFRSRDEALEAAAAHNSGS